MDFNASNIYDRYRPSHCDLRVRLARRPGLDSAPVGAFGELLQRLGNEHEARHLAALEALHGPAFQSQSAAFDERRADTRAAVHRVAPLIYQPMLFGWREVAGERDFIVGIPDLLIREGDGYVLRDCKLARRIDHRADVLRQVELYGWLYAQEFGSPPKRLEVLLGDGAVAELPYDGGVQALAELDEVRLIVSLPEAPYEPVGWSKCGECAFKGHCWPQAEAQEDVSLLRGVDQSLARHLHSIGINTIEALAARFSPDELAEVRREQATRVQRVGVKAREIILHAEAHLSGKPLQVGRFPFSLDRQYVMFDLEGLPAQIDDVEKIYLWGMQVYGPVVGPYQPAVAPPEAGGDEEGWLRFLREAGGIFREHGDIPFIHWATYEKAKLNMYMERYGDRDGVGRRVLNNLENILPITEQTVVLPEPSYSLKVVEKQAGYTRSVEEGNGLWSIAKYIEAIESADPAAYEAVLDQVLTYNREDLEATWAVFTWLAREYGGEPPRPG